ncbi:protein adenylyltransferase SelO [Marinospirillum insulare]|uniref:Protein nucleotidyltransferase YdiU n=1 Tax=Marinospirillum insulare TaxID=217169 RepID=A0ABQ5ZY80_9GAMM|nr:YdiU family protein [Marinospirillum insulare]GLR64451.1 UPF0061 protein [Marinospirillum insulare]
MQLHTLEFVKRFTHLPKRFYQLKKPTPLAGQLALVAVSADAAQLIDLNLCKQDQQELIEFLAGRWLPKKSQPLAMKYAGHQFGFYNPDLGDGRGLLLGEVRNKLGQVWDLHLKGAGQTAWSRFADGRAVLRSSIREFLASEALFHLGIPTTRALALVTSSEPVRRERIEAATTLLRLTASHIRFGHFEHLYYTNDLDGLKQLLDFVIKQHYPEIQESQDPAASLLAQVLERTALLVAKWQAYGFCHGVLNTDNMSILGETFDFGPYAFLDTYEPSFVGNHSDDQGRYAFNRQPSIVHWNLICLGQALLPLSNESAIRQVLDSFTEHYTKHYRQAMAARLGVNPDENWQLVERFLYFCELTSCDWTRVLRALAEGELTEANSLMLNKQDQLPRGWQEWLSDWQLYLAKNFSNQAVVEQTLTQVNPCVLPRTHLLEQAIQSAEKGDFSEVNRLLAIFRQPFTRKGKQPQDTGSVPDWALGLSLSCSS